MGEKNENKLEQLLYSRYAFKRDVATKPVSPSVYLSDFHLCSNLSTQHFARNIIFLLTQSSIKY